MNDTELKDLIGRVMAELGIGEDKNGAVSSKAPESASTVSGDVLPDILLEDYTKELGVKNPAHPEEFLEIKAMTGARLGLGRAGSRYRTRPYLRFLADHAGAMDAVQNDVPDELIQKLGLLKVQTKCTSKEEYLTRPDLGRQFDDETRQLIRSKCIKNPEVQIIISEGLSSTAVTENIEELFPALYQGLQVKKLTVGTPIFVKYGRVPAEDVITETVGSAVTIILIGERPGLSTYASMSAYMTYGGSVGIPEGNRTVISNIHKDGTNPAEAGAHIADVARRMFDQKASGVNLD
jgi:ethanolamine ammonia-lyase small subunit